MAVIDEPLELPLGHDSVGKTKTAEILNADASVLESRNVLEELKYKISFANQKKENVENRNRCAQRFEMVGSEKGNLPSNIGPHCRGTRYFSKRG